MEDITDNIENKFLTGLLPEEINALIVKFPKFKCLEVFKNISKGEFDIDNFTTLKLDERNYLVQNFIIPSTKILEQKTDVDGTIKISLELFDKNIVEAVLLLDSTGRKTVCLSSQVGCPLACKFCKTGMLGFARNLYASEIVEQFLWLEKITSKVDNIVFMGMGEALLNAENVGKAIQIISHKKGRDFSKRRITISTAGFINGISWLGKNLPHIRLAVSLTTANEKLRESLMPIAKTNQLYDLKKALENFSLKTKRRITLELALMHNVNTSFEHAKEVILFVQDLNAHINLIPWNKVSELDFETPSDYEVLQFERWLKNANLNVTTRRKQGSDIAGACGQLGKVILK